MLFGSGYVPLWGQTAHSHLRPSFLLALELTSNMSINVRVETLGDQMCLLPTQTWGVAAELEGQAPLSLIVGS